MEEVYEIHALRYGSNQNRTRLENFLETVDDHDSAMPLDYFVWLIRNENRAVVVDTGFDHIEAKKRGRTISALPSERLAQLGICLLYTSPSPRDNRVSRMPSSA